MCGSFAGVMAISIVYPIDLTKTMISINHIPRELSVFQGMNMIFKNHGFLSFYKGLGATFCVD